MWLWLRMVLAATLLAAVLASAGAAVAQDVTGKGADGSAVVLPDPLTRESVRDVLAAVTDDEARNLLLKELAKQIAAREAELAARDQRTFTEVLSDWGAAVGSRWLEALVSIPEIPGAISATFDRYLEERGDSSLSLLGASLAASLLGGYLLALGAARLVRGRQARVRRAIPTGLGPRIGILAARLGFHLLRLAVFLVAALLINRAINGGVQPDLATGRKIIAAISYTWLALILARFVLAPGRPELRLCAVDETSATFLTRRIVLIFGWSAFGIAFIEWSTMFGTAMVNVGFGVWLGLVFYGLMALTIWQAKDAIANMVAGSSGATPRWRAFARTWPRIAVGLVIANWLLVELLAATGNRQLISGTALNITLLVILALPLIETAIPAVVRAIWPPNPEHGPALQAAHTQTQAGLARCMRIPILALIVILLTSLWGLNLRDLASQGVGAELAGGMVQIFLITIIAYGLWELVTIIAERQMAIERVALGGGLEHEDNEGEGGRGGTRLGTLMPLIRTTAHVVIAGMAVLSILGQIGVNVTPLLAGAGVLGLAVGFGAQALVRDILSGVFFLIDDAFRKGEFIELGDIAGTVESISIRSMKLRHQNGPLHTVPFGEIKYLTNFSRDWVIMKLPLRVTYDTDVEKLRKMIKKLGQELLADPELGPKFLDPLKSQGVIQMDDSAMIVRVKFKTRPGDQWAMRTRIYARLRELFEEEGIKFAHREVTVRIADNGHATKDAGPTEREKIAASGAIRAIDEEAKKPSLADQR
jgi:moderate conductance mechanosensitive channel